MSNNETLFITVSAEVADRWRRFAEKANSTAEKAIEHLIGEAPDSHCLTSAEELMLRKILGKGSHGYTIQAIKALRARRGEKFCGLREAYDLVHMLLADMYPDMGFKTMAERLGDWSE